jgi:hydroxymethylglutaryl-CoA reductase
MTSIAVGLPGADLIEKGLRDLERGAETIESLLVSMSAPRLRVLGLAVAAPIADPELRLYRRLAAQHGAAAHSKYNSLVRRIVSYQRAAACAR